MIVTSPNADQYGAVSSTDSPVTDTDDTAVNAAVMNGARPCPWVATGSDSRTVPTAAAIRKAPTMADAGRCRTAAPPGRPTMVTR